MRIEQTFAKLLNLFFRKLTISPPPVFSTSALLSPSSSCLRCRQPLAVESANGLCASCSNAVETSQAAGTPQSPIVDETTHPHGADAGNLTRSQRPLAGATQTIDPNGHFETDAWNGESRLQHSPAGYDLHRYLGGGGMGDVYLALEHVAERTVVTPDKPMWMSGYASRTGPAEGAEIDLWAKAAVFQAADGKKLILVTLDLVGIDRDTSQAVCKRIMAKHQLSREAIALSVSHTHCGPVVGKNLRSMYFFDDAQAKLVDEYTDALPGKILKAVDGAVANLEAMTLSWATGTSGFVVNRRENKEAEVPVLREKGLLKGPVDHDVPVLAARDGKGNLKGIVFGYACHATVMAYMKWSGDYPGFAMLDVEKAHPGAVAMFFAGCGADQNPLPRRQVELARNYGKQLADSVEAVLAKPMKPLAPEFTASYREIDLPLKEVPTREELIKQSLAADKFIAARARMLLKQLDAGHDIPASYPYPVQTWRLGQDLALVTLGGEVVVDYSLRLKKELGGHLWVMAYANDVMAYIPSARVLKEGGYEGATSMIYYGLPSIWSDKVEDLIVEEVKRQRKK
jgi:neutral ceramidase